MNRLSPEAALRLSVGILTLLRSVWARVFVLGLTFSIVSIAHAQTGLKGEYYNDQNLGSLAMVRTDGVVDFNWGEGSPGGSVNSDHFSVRWTGQVQPLYSEYYTFTTASDDGVRLWVNGSLIIDNWTDHGPTDDSGGIFLSAGQKYDIKMEYYENSGGAMASLRWQSGSQSYETIPQARLSIPSQAPTCSVSASSTSINSGQSVVITVQANAGSSPLAYVNVDQTSPTNGFYGPGDTWGETPPNNGYYSVGGNTGSFTRHLTLTLTTPGTYYFRGAVNDGTGWYYSSGTVAVTVITVPPSCSVSASSTSIYSGQSVVITVQASAPTSNLAYVNVDQTSPTNGFYGPGDTGGENPPNNGYYGVPGGHSYTRNLTLTLTTPRTYIFRGAVNDGTGWYYSGSNVAVTVTNRAPIGVFDGVTSSLKANQTISGYGWAGDQDTGGPAATVQILIDGGFRTNANLGGSRPDSTFTSAGWDFSFNVGALSVGTHTIQAIAVDSFGASATIGTKSFTIIANQPPVGWIDQYDIGSGWQMFPNTALASWPKFVVQKPIKLQGWANDPDQSNLAGATIKFYRNGIFLGDATSITAAGNGAVNWTFVTNSSSIGFGAWDITGVIDDHQGGTYTMGVHFQDVGGQSGIQYSVPVEVVDYEAPIGAIDNYNLGQGTLNFDSTMPFANWPSFGLGQSVTIGGFAKDPDVAGLFGGNVKIYSDGNLLAAVNGVDAGDAVTWSYTISTSTLGLGNHSITAVVTDIANKTYTMKAHFMDGVANGSGPGIKDAIPINVLSAQAPQITAQPQSQTVGVGSTVTLTVGATGIPTPNYAWYKDNVAVGNSTFISGAQSATLTITNIGGSDAGHYTVRVSNSSGTVTSTDAIISLLDGVASGGTYYIRNVTYLAGTTTTDNRTNQGDNIQAGDDFNPNTNPDNVILAAGNQSTPGAVVTYQVAANKQIRLEPGFHANLGTTFHAISSGTTDNHQPKPLAIVFGGASDGTVGSGFSYQIGGQNGTSYWATGLPPGLFVNSKTGEIYGVPTQAGTYQVTINVNNDGGSSSKTVTFTIAAGDPTIPGVLPGAISVDNKGAANYSVALAIPPGRAGLQPSLSLNYSSDSGTGPLGVGFAVSTGFPQGITRGRSILARDGVVQGVHFDETDKFYLDGKRLICVSGDYGTADSKYRTEVDSFATITAYGSGTHIDGFRMESKDGLVFYFGRNVTALSGGSAYSDDYHAFQLADGETTGQALTWALRQVEDRVGNYVELRYDESDFAPRLLGGEHVLTSVRYTGLRGGAQPGFIVGFRYNESDNPTALPASYQRPDGGATYQYGRKTVVNARLDRIAVFAKDDSTAGTPRRSFALKYDAPAKVGLLRLVEVVQQDVDGIGTKTLTTDFNWPSTSLALALPSPSFHPLTVTGLKTNSRFRGDFDGDGRSDLLFYTQDPFAQDKKLVSVSRTDSGGWAEKVMPVEGGYPKGPHGQTMFPVITGDFNGDGRTDLVWANFSGGSDGGGWWVTFSTGNGFGAPQLMLANPDNSPHFMYTNAGSPLAVDLDGDGCEELMFQPYVEEVHLHLDLEEGDVASITTGTADVYATCTIVNDTPMHLLRFNSSTGTWQDKALDSFYSGKNAISLKRADLDGDGRSDLIVTIVNTDVKDNFVSYNTINASWAISALRNIGGDKFQRTDLSILHESQISETYSTATGSFLMLTGDVNGDGLEDLVYFTWDASHDTGGWAVALAKGDGTFESGAFDGIPGKVAIDSATPNTNTFLQKKGSLRVVEGTPEVSVENHIDEFSGFGIEGAMLLDLNGDGKKDFVWYTAERGWRCFLAGTGGFDLSNPLPVFGGASDSTQYNRLGTHGSEFACDTIPLDAIGDDRESLLLLYRDDVQPGTNASDILFAEAAANQANRLSLVTDNLGAQQKVAYGAISNDAIYTSGAAVSYPIRETRHKIVASDVWKDAGGDLNNRAWDHYSYQYSGSRTDFSGRGFLGFHSFVTLDQQTNIFKYQFLAQSFPMTGLTAREQTYRYWHSPTGTDLKFRLISSHDNTVVFDEVVKSAGDSAPWGTLYPFISQAVESRWEDSTDAHFTLDPGAASSKPECLFKKQLPGDAHIKITAQSWFDQQPLNGSPLTTAPTPYQASDTTGDGTGGNRGNSVIGSTNYDDFHALNFNHKITYGNLTQLKTDYGDGFTETVVNAYADPIDGLTGLVDSVSTSVHSPGYGDQQAPTKRYAHWRVNDVGLMTPLVKIEQIDAADNALDLTTTYTRDSRGRMTDTTISGSSVPGDLRSIGSYSVSSSPKENYDDLFDLPGLTKNAEPYQHSTSVIYHPMFAWPTSVTGVNGATTTMTYDIIGRPLAVVDTKKGLAARTEYRRTLGPSSDWTSRQSVSLPDNFNGVAAGAGITDVTGVSLDSAYAIKTTETAEQSFAPFRPTVCTYYDRLGRVIRTTKENYSGGKTITDTVYNSLGQVIAVSLPYPEGGTKYWTKTEYDALGRVVKVTAPNGTITTTGYLGRATSVTVDARASSGTTDAAKLQTNATLVDAKGRTVKVWNADNVPAFTSTLGATSVNSTPSISFDLDGFGRMRTTTLKGQGDKTITATYDELGQQTSLSDPDKGYWQYLSNVLGQVVWQKDARNNVTASIFDHLGRPLTRINEESAGPIETAEWYYYDTATIASSNPTLHLVDKGTQGWIGAQQRQEAQTSNAPGYAGTGNNSATSTIHFFDDKGRPLVDLTTIDNKWFYTYATYDDYSRTSGLRYYWRQVGFDDPTQNPQAWQDFGISYTYDSRSYVTSISDTRVINNVSSPRVWWEAGDKTPTNPGYDYLDRPVLFRKGGGYWTTKTYRAEDGLLTNIVTQGTATLQSLGFSYDGLGNLKQRTGLGGTEDLEYDILNRLTHSSKQGYTSYEPNGNIKNKRSVDDRTTSDYTYDPTHPHAVHEAFGYSMGYDLNGNLNSRTGNGETWDFRYAGFDKPRWMTKHIGSNTLGSEFLYDANRSRTVHLEYDQTTNGVPSHYVRKRVYGLGPTLEANYRNDNASGNPSWSLQKVRIYMPGPDGVIGAREFNPQTSVETPLVYHYDHIGSIDAITSYGSADGTPAMTDEGKSGRYSEDAWGQRRNPSSWTSAPSATDTGGSHSLTPRGFTSHEMLDDLGLVHMNGRIYDPLLGRVLSADTVVQFPDSAQSYNRYSYVRNNPLSKVDPTGFTEAAALPIVVAGGAVTVAAAPVEAVFAAGAGSASVTVINGVRAWNAAPGFDGGNMYGGFGAATYNLSHWQWSQSDNSRAANDAATTPKKPVEKGAEAAKTKESSSGGQMEPEKKPDGKDTNRRNIKQNKASGDAWEKEVNEKVLPQTQSEIRPQITVKPNAPGAKNVRLDAVGKDAKTGAIKLTDAKASETAPLTPNQTAGYPIIEESGGVVVGAGKAPYTGGTVIPPTKVDIIRKPVPLPPLE